MAVSVAPVVLVPTQTLGTAAKALYTAPASVNGIVVKKGVVTNGNTTAADSLSLWLVPSGGTEGSATLVIPKLSVPASSDAILYELGNLVLMPGDALWAASASGYLNLVVTGFQM